MHDFYLCLLTMFIYLSPSLPLSSYYAYGYEGDVTEGVPNG